MELTILGPWKKSLEEGTFLGTLRKGTFFAWGQGNSFLKTVVICLQAEREPTLGELAELQKNVFIDFWNFHVIYPCIPKFWRFLASRASEYTIPLHVGPPLLPTFNTSKCSIRWKVWLFSQKCLSEPPWDHQGLPTFRKVFQWMARLAPAGSLLPEVCLRATMGSPGAAYL